MSKLKVTDMAGEFGIPTDEVMALLRQMDVPVRGPASVLTDDQVARVRLRWEREKRHRAEKATAPAAPARRKKATSATSAAAAAAPAAAETEAPKPKARTTRAKTAAKAAKAAPEPAPEATTGVRRRKRADIVVPAPVEEAPPAPEVETQAPEPPSPADIVHGETYSSPEPDDHHDFEPPPPVVSREPVMPRDVMPRDVAPSAPAASAGPSSPASNRPRPRPVTPGAPRPRPVASSSGFMPPRPVASATPGGGPGGGARRDDRKPGAGTGTAAPGGAATQDRGRRGRKGKRGPGDQEAIDANVSKTLAAMRGGPQRRTASDMRREVREGREAGLAEAAEREKKTIRVNEFITVSELAQILKLSATEIVGFAFKNMGLMVTVNQRLDFDQIELIAGEFGFQAVREDEYQAEDALTVEADTAETLKPRPPVVTIMGHVDHGKTSLLDYVRKATVVAGEAGGITQHIGAYHVTLPSGKTITFLDTPGHQAFTAMRARGAQVTDIVVLVVAADDSVMPQTIEAISHAKNAGVPIIVAINKIDLPQANPGKVKQELLSHGVVLEEFGGTVLSAMISAKKGTNVDALLEAILLQAELLDLKANPDRRATGTVIEAQLDPGKGPVATVLVQSGTLRVGDDFITGMFAGRVRALMDERGKPVKEAGPAIPVQVLGAPGVPMAGDQLLVVEEATSSREIAQRRQRLDREAKSRRGGRGVSLEDFMAQTAPGDMRTLQIIIKADQGGPAEALADALSQLSTSEVSVEIIHRGVGAISESDILLAKSAKNAIIIGFHVRPDNNARAAAEREGVDIKLYRIIYEAVNDVRAALEGMLRPEKREVVLGEAQVREVFRISKIGTIAGCMVRSGVINRQSRVRVVREGVEVYEGVISSLKRFKDDVREVKEGFECGIGVENFNDIKVNDIIECYRTEEVARTLAASGQ
ncbi:MAG TPA: translation initiation factor IF-2 [Gemmatimonadaceae bacterium]|nr:translation initiation factor IF-2 [Gemmatimonadaceae bacterium]